MDLRWSAAPGGSWPAWPARSFRATSRPVQTMPDIGQAGARKGAAEAAGDTEVGMMYTAAGRLWVAGVPLDAERFGPTGVRVPLPTYPYERDRYWVEPDPVEFQDRDSAADTGTGPLSPREWFAVPTWRPLRPSDRTEALEACVLFAAGPRGEALAEALRASGTEVTVVRPGEAYDLAEPAPARVVHAHALDGEPAGTDLDAAWQAQELGFFSALALVKAIAAVSRDIHLDLAHLRHRGRRSPAPCAVPSTPRWPGSRGWRRWRSRGSPFAASTWGRAPGRRRWWRSCAGRCDGSSEVTVRGGRRWGLDFAQVTLDDDEPELREGGCYLITGGLGGIGIKVAEDLAPRTRGVMVLVSRAGLPPREEWDDYLARHGGWSGGAGRSRPSAGSSGPGPPSACWRRT